MEFITLTGRKKKLTSLKKYLIKWEDKSRSKFQKSVKDFLYKYWKHDVVFEEFRMAGTKLSFDFYNSNKRVAIEVQGIQHEKHVEFFHGKGARKWLSQIKKDLLKHKFCEINNITLIEIFSDEEISFNLFKEKGIDLLC